MRDSLIRLAAWVLVGLSCYAGAYASLVAPVRIDFGADCSLVLTCYRAGGGLTHAVFAPANWVDRRIRARFWKTRIGGPILDPSEDEWPESGQDCKG
jgi:hypothetical protein